jgi:hypothetical protein
VTYAGVAALSTTGIVTPRTAGLVGSVTVTALDPYGNRVSNYTGTVHFTSSDGQAVLPGNYAFVAGDGGQHVFTNGVTLKTSGAQAVTATDTVTSSLTSSQSGIAVNAAALSQLTMTGLSAGVTAGASNTVTVSARDTYANLVTSYTGSVQFTSTDGQGVLPGVYPFVSGDAGTHVFSGVKLKTAGAQSLHAQDTPHSLQVSASTNVAPDTSTFRPVVSGVVTPTEAFAWQPVTVEAQDGYGNRITSYVGMVAFSSSDPSAELPLSYTFAATDAGIRNFGAVVRFHTPGDQSLTATDVGTTVAGAQAPIHVNNDTTAPTISLTAPQDQVYLNGQSPFSLTVAGSYWDGGSGVLGASLQVRLVNGAVVSNAGWFSGGNINGLIASTLLAHGLNQVQLVASDNLGNAATPEVRAVYVDTAPPSGVITSPLDGAVVTGSGSDQTVTVIGTATDDVKVASVTVNGVTATLVPTGPGAVSFSAVLTIPSDSTTQIAAVVTDMVGNVADATISNVAGLKSARITHVTLDSAAGTPPSAAVCGN